MGAVSGLWGEPVRVSPAVSRKVRTVGEARDLRRDQSREREKARRLAGNPMIASCGFGPEGAKSGQCAYLTAHHFDKRYYKCLLRGKRTRGSATDHRVSFPACGRFALREGAVAVGPGRR
jgi:hypothetical protein